MSYKIEAISNGPPPKKLVVRGIIPTSILSILGEDGSSNSYRLAQKIREFHPDLARVLQPNVKTSLQRLNKLGLIEELEKPLEGARGKARFFRLTAAGQEFWQTTLFGTKDK